MHAFPIAEFYSRHAPVGSVGIVALSGGPDSVALTHLLVELLRAGKLARLILAHVNHQLRGDESDSDEAFVQKFAADLQLDCKTTRIDVAAIAAAEHENLEGIARRERYAWLTEIARTEGATWIATGHTADDQAETVLFRLLRGSGIVGLGGMAERRPLGNGLSLLRPLLSVRRQTLHEFLQERKITYRVDSSNRDLRFTRNRLRLELLPLLEKNYNRGTVEVFNRLAEQAQELSVEVVAQADRLLTEAELPRAGAMLVFSAERLQKASGNLVREMFRRVWLREAWPMGAMDFEHWHRLADIVAGESPVCDFPGGIRVQRVGRVVQIVSRGVRR